MGIPRRRPYEIYQRKNEEAVAPPVGKIPEDNMNMEEHKVNEDYESLSYIYLLGKGQRDIKNLDVNGIKEKKTLSGNTALHIAARYGINEVVKKIAESDMKLLFSENSNKDKPYHVAARAGQITTLRTLLEVYIQHIHGNGADQQPISDVIMALTDPNEQGNTIFHEALINGGHKGAAIFEALASPVTINDKQADTFSLESYVYGEDVALSMNKEGKTPLYLAIEFGHKQIVERLLTNCKGNPKGKSPIFAAIVKQDSDMLGMILHNKEKWIHIKDDQEWLPLHYAAYYGYLDGVLLLLKECNSCTLKKEKKHGLFPLHLASNEGYLEVFKKLLIYSLDPCEMLSNKGQNVLHIAAKSGKHNVVTYILQVPELENMINQKDDDGNTPLHLAAGFFHPTVVLTLTWDKRVDLTMVNKKTQTAFDVAVDTMQKNPTLREFLTWSALRSATPRSPPQSEVNKFQTAQSPPQRDVYKGLAGLYREKPHFPSQSQSSNIEQFKDRIETLIVVSTLIVTVTFAAGIQFPGGSNDDGQAKLIDKGMFQLYIISITLSMYGALIATILLFLARLGNISLMELALKSAMPLLGITLTTLSLAFLAAVYLVVSKLTWLLIIFLLISIISIFAVVSVYILFLYIPSSSTSRIARYISYYPFLLLAWLEERLQKGDK